jgi:ribose transport system permease protein/putative xylitol transport system permease protein
MQSAEWRQVRTAVLPVGLLVALIGFFAVWESAFLSRTNIEVLLAQGAPLLIISLGATFVVLSGGVDLSVGAAAGLAAAVSGILIEEHGFGIAGLVIAVGVGVLAGVLNAVLVTVVRLPSFIMTLSTVSIFFGATLHVLSGQGYFVRNLPVREELAIGRAIPHIPNAALIALGLWAAMVIVNLRTRFGRYVTAIGAGEPVAALSGVPVFRYRAAALIVSGAFAGCAGALLLLQLGSVSPLTGQSYLLDSIAAIVIGGTALGGGVGGIPRTLLGVAVLTVISNGLNVLAVSSFTQEIVKGVIVIVAVLMTIDRDRMQNLIK